MHRRWGQLPVSAAVVAIAVLVAGAALFQVESQRNSRAQREAVTRVASNVVDDLRVAVDRASRAAATLAVAQQGVIGEDEAVWRRVVEGLRDDLILGAALLRADGMLEHLVVPGVDLEQLLDAIDLPGLRLYEPGSETARVLEGVAASGDGLVFGPMAVPVLGQIFLGVEPLMDLVRGVPTGDHVLVMVPTPQLLDVAGITSDGTVANAPGLHVEIVTETPSVFVPMEGLEESIETAGDGRVLDDPVVLAMNTPGVRMRVSAVPDAGWNNWSSTMMAIPPLAVLLAWLLSDQLRRRLAETLRAERALEDAREQEWRAAYTRKLEEVNAVQEDLLAKASHELRTPLTVIRGFGAMLSEHHEDLAPDVRRKAVESITRNADRLIEAVNGMLELADHGPAFDRTLVDVRGCVQKAASMLGMQPTINGEATAFASANDVQQVVRALLSNARRYGSAPFEVDLSEVDGHAEIIVRDHGDGISPEAMDHLFAPFRQSSVGLQRTATGLGLGLPVTRLLAERNDGDVTVTSTSGPTEFLVRLPRRLLAVPMTAHADQDVDGRVGQPA